MPTKNSIKDTTKKLTTTSTTKKASTKKTVTQKVIDKNKVKINPVSEEKQNKSKAELLKQAEALSNIRKGLSKTQKVTIASLAGVAVATSVVVPLVCYVVNNSKPFDISIYTNYENLEDGQEVFNIKPGTKISELQPIVKEGYIFKGYFMDEECTQAYDPNYKLKESDKIYALLVEDVKYFTTIFHYQEEEYVLDVNTKMTIEQVQDLILDKLNMTQEEFETVEGKHFVGLYKENNVLNEYMSNYKLTTEDTNIYALFEINTYRVSMPEEQGVVITNLSGDIITNFDNIPHGYTIEFKVRLKEGYFGEPVVKINGETLLAVNEVYSYEVTSEKQIVIEEVFEISGQLTLSLGTEIKDINYSDGLMLEKVLKLAGYTEENTIGFYRNSDFTNYVDIYNTTITKGITLFTREATLDKVNIRDGKITKAYWGIEGEVVIPRMFKGSLVTNISHSAFCEQTNLTNIVIPYGITIIGSEAFRGSGLTEVKIPSSVEIIEGYAFNTCSSLSSLIFEHGSNLKIVGSTAFQLTAITNIEIPDSVESIGSYAFSGCKELSSVKLPSNLTELASSTFRNCKSLTNIELPSHLLKIGDSAFNGSQLDSINIPNTVNYIGDSAFFGTKLTSITIPASVEYLGVQAFNTCRSLSSVIFEQGSKLTAISNEVFQLTAITNIDIPQSVQSIGTQAFANTLLTSINIPSKVKTIGKNCFKACIGLESVVFETDSELTNIGHSAFYGCTSLQDIVIPNSVTEIGAYAFFKCSSLTSINIPQGVEYIGGYAFRASSIVSATFEAQNWVVSNSSSTYELVLDDEYNNAKYLKDTYHNYNWSKKR